MTDALIFWLLTLLAGTAGLPFAAFLYARLPRYALLLARPLGLLLAVYPVWLLASSGVLTYGRAAAAAGIALLAVAAAARLWLRRGPVSGWPWRLWLAGEALFTAAFFGYALFRSYAPEVWQTEKPMDMAIINAINRSESFPPHDPWLAGTDLNYYYFGHYVVASLIRVTGVEPEVGYNLGLALVFALCTTAVFALAATLYAAVRSQTNAPTRAPWVAGALAVVFALLVGNAAGGVQLLRDGGPVAAYDWWSPSRVISGTANEFPLFSFLLGDLHAHVLATPFALLVVAFALQLAVRGPRRLERPGLAGVAPPAAELLLAGLLLGALYATNTLDYPTAAVLGLLGLVLAATRRPPALRLRWAALWGAAWVVSSALLYLPFVLSYVPAAKGIAVVGEHDPFSVFAADMALIYALPLWVLAAAFAGRLRVPRRIAVWAAIAAVFVLTLLAPSGLAGLPLVLSVAAVSLWAALDRRRTQPARFFWSLAAVGVGLVATGEFIYIRDVFENTASFRFNTVFKAGYQAWWLLAIVAACGVVWSRRWLPRPLWAGWLAGLLAILGLVTAYSWAAPYSRTAAFADGPTLDGLRWLDRRAPGDVAAIRWLRETVDGTPVIVEAVGADYDPEGSARISTFTGLPAVLGWAGHEVQWGHDPGRRREDVDELYATRDVTRARSLLRRYGVRYVVVGSLERRRYPRASLAKFARLGVPAFQRGPTAVYAVPWSVAG